MQNGTSTTMNILVGCYFQVCALVVSKELISVLLVFFFTVFFHAIKLYYKDFEVPFSVLQP